MEANPVLEEGEEIEIAESETKEEDSEDLNDEMEQALEDFDYEEYTDDYIPEYKTRANNRSADDEDKSVPIVFYDSFLNSLQTQLGFLNLNEQEELLASTLIGNLDDNGYLGRDLNSIVNDLAFTQGIETTYEELNRLLKMIQKFDPPGIGARDLNECLLIQLLNKDQDDPNIRLATKIIEKDFNSFAKKHYQKIIEKFDINEEELKGAIVEITKLNPKPGGSINSNKVSNQTIIPDFILTYTDRKPTVALTSTNMPELRISKDYKDMLKAYSEGGKPSKEDKKGMYFVKQKIEAAKWFIDAIVQRQNTLLKTAQAIVSYQSDYFIDGDEMQLKPMILKNIAEMVNMDISTISRVVNSKFIQTPFGTFLLKKLFSESLSTDSGGEVSTIEVKNILKKIIDNEDKKQPLTDEKLTLLLKEKKYNIARRTVAKYREQLNIPVGRLRKKL